MENLAVVLAQVRNPLNIGAAARAMANFGFRDLRLAAAYRVASEEARSGPNADEVLLAAQDFPDLPSAIHDATLVIGTTSATKRDVRLEIKRLEQAAPLLRAAASTHKIALLFGSEKFGLSNEEMTYCHWLIRIPTVEEVPSMNLGQAVALTLYELIRDPGIHAEGPSLPARAPSVLLEEISQRLTEALAIAGYVHMETVAEKVRRTIRRMDWREDDAVMWLGMLRQILWKLRHPS